MGGRDYCCVVGCSNRRSDLPKGYAFHQFPKAPLSRRNSWIHATGRALTGKYKFVVTDNTKICGHHFVLGRKNADPTNIDYVPTMNLPLASSNAETPKRKTQASKRAIEFDRAVEHGTQSKKKKLTRTGQISYPIDINDVQHEVEVESTDPSLYTATLIIPGQNVHTYTSDHAYHKFWVHPNATKVTETGVQCQPRCENKFQQTNHVHVQQTQVTTTSSLLQIKCRQQQKLISELSSKLQTVHKEKETLKNELSKHKFCMETLLTNDENVQFYTGLPNIATFNALLEYLRPKAERLTYWRGKQTSTTGHIGNRGRVRSLSIDNEFFAVLVRLRLGLLVEDIAARFAISKTHFSKLFNTWIRFLRLELELLFPFPSREQVNEHMPPSFAKFPNTVVILDCTEIYVQKPSALQAQRQTWSSYKHRNTYKILVGISPDGTVTFVSTLYGGAASDRFIVNKSGILNLVKEGDNVMADRGFDISDDLKKCGATLNIPPFRCGEFQLSASQVEETRRIAEVRIHVERAIQRIKTFHILNGTMPVTLTMVAEDIFKTCSYLTNFQTPIIKCEINKM
ncbi:unnamed protein product [Mytilus edulis]|uniref:THAP-type domain-containing protein n=1 Tax=Mytilus edulis TaxID=6550 RepID=A0A8S3UG96_MYTED|nr:unnamed protein product [Mytilus edulis]